MIQDKSLGSKIKEIRKEKKITQEQLAGTFISRAMLSKIETGSATPSLQTIIYLAEKLDTPLYFFLGNDNLNDIDSNKDEYIIPYQHIAFMYKNKEYDKVIDYFNGIPFNKTINVNESYYKCLLYVAHSHLVKGDYQKVNIFSEELFDNQSFG